MTTAQELEMGPSERWARIEGFSDEAVAVCAQLDRVEARLDDLGDRLDARINALAERLETAMARLRASLGMTASPK